MLQGFWSSFWKRSILTDNTSVYLVTQSTYAIRIQVELPTNEATLRGGKIREQGSSPETKQMFMMIKLKYKQRFRLPKLVIELMKQRE